MKRIALVFFLGMTTALAPLQAKPGAEPPAASLAFTSGDPIVLEGRKLMDAGSFKEAEGLIAANTNNASADALRARGELAEIIRRTRHEYSLSPEGLLAKVKKSIPDATQADVDRWAAETRVRYRMIDGQKLFFRREPQNIYLFSAEAKKRKEKAGIDPEKPKWDLVSHLKTIVDDAERAGEIEVEPMHHSVTYTLTIPANTAGIKAGSLAKVWLPYPQEYRQQRNVKLISANPVPKVIAPSAVEGNPVAGGPQRTLYFEERVGDPAKPIVFKASYSFDSFAYYPKLDENKAEPLPADWNGADLGERLPHIAFTPDMRAKVAEITKGETNALAKARSVFRWVSANIPWNAEDEYCIIPSLAVKGFTARRGDCGVQNSVFVTMCRIAGVPARWQSGYETKPGDSWGMHDWAEIYIAPWGWLPADASYGVKKSDDPRIADFYCGHQDSYRMIVNLDWGRELFPPKESLRSEPADFQRGEVEVDGRNLYFDQWDYKMDLKREPAGNVE